MAHVAHPHGAHEVGQARAQAGARPEGWRAAPSSSTSTTAVCAAVRMRSVPQRQLTSRAANQKAPVRRGRWVCVRGGQGVLDGVHAGVAVREVARRGGDGRAGQAARQELGVADEHLEHVVKHVARAGAALAEVRLGEEAERLAVHLEHVHVEVGQVELTLTPAQERAHVLPAPNARVRGEGRGQLVLEVERRGRRRGCGRLAALLHREGEPRVAPQQLARAERQRQRQPLHGAGGPGLGQRDGQQLHRGRRGGLVPFHADAVDVAIPQPSSASPCEGG